VSLIAIVVAAFGLLNAVRTWKRSGSGWPGEQDGPMNRNRFLGVIGILFSAGILLMLILQLIPALVLDPCTIG
jgi:hypothetical protein